MARSLLEKTAMNGQRSDSMRVVAIGHTVVASAFTGAMAIVFCISFAAIVYSGNMAPYLSRGIGLTLIGASAMALVGSLFLTEGETIVQPQDVTTIIIALAVASMANAWGSKTPDSLFPTVAVFIAIATAATGLLAYLFGRFRLGFIVRFIPYPVLGGFIAATGYLLVTGALSMMLREHITVWTLPLLFHAGNPEKWGPWLLAGTLFSLLSRRIPNSMTLPACIVISIGLFYGILWLTGTALATARGNGLLLGPFSQPSFVAGLSPTIAAKADWSALLVHAPSIFAAAGMAVIGSLLNASALELATGKPIDPNRDLRGVGAANLVSSLCGGLVGYQLVGETLFARAVAIKGRLAPVAVSIATLGSALLGARYLSVLPVGVFAATIAYLGVDLLVAWLWTERQKLSFGDFAIVLLILGISATIGLLSAIVAGVLAASIKFVVGYAELDVVRLRSSVAAMRSRVERGDSETSYLARNGGNALVYELYGYLFFGTAHRLLAELKTVATSTARQPGFILLDFKRVTGIDASATFALGKLHEVCESHGVKLHVSGLSPRLESSFRRMQTLDRLHTFKELSDSIREVEHALLAQTEEGAGVACESGFLEQLRQLHPEFDPDASFETFWVETGHRIVEQGAATDSIIVLQQGTLAVEQVNSDGKATPLAEIQPGAMVGEIGFYASVPRTADVVAKSTCRLARITCETLDRLASDNPALVADIHRLSAAFLARRLMRTTSLLRDADL